MDNRTEKALHGEVGGVGTAHALAAHDQEALAAHHYLVVPPARRPRYPLQERRYPVALLFLSRLYVLLQLCAVLAVIALVGFFLALILAPAVDLALGYGRGGDRGAEAGPRAGVEVEGPQVVKAASLIAAPCSEEEGCFGEARYGRPHI